MEIVQFIAQIFKQYGYFIVFVTSFLESLIVIGFILPGGFIVLLSGYFARVDNLSIFVVGFMAFWGMFLGDIINYGLGRAGLLGFIQGRKRFRRLVDIHNSGKKFLESYGIAAIIYSHVLGYTRSIVCFSAGLVDFPFRKYLISSFVASTIWAVLFVGLGYFVASSTEGLEDLGIKITIIAWILLFVFICLKILQKTIMQRMTKKN